jgi:hypothetical protein
MKKALTLAAVAAMTAFVACGPSAEEKAKMEERAKQIQDSIAASISESMQKESANADSGKVMNYDEHGNPVEVPASTAAATPAGSEHGHDHGHNHDDHKH